MTTFLKLFGRSLINPQFVPTAFKVACVVGTLLLVINHGHALLHQQMTRERWLAAALTYCVPYLVNIHGQLVSHSRRRHP